MTSKPPKPDPLLLIRKLDLFEPGSDSGGEVSRPGAAAPEITEDAAEATATTAAVALADEGEAPGTWKDAMGLPEDRESPVAVEKFGFIPTSWLDFTNDDRWQLDIPRELMARVEIKHARGLTNPGPNNWQHGEFVASKFNSGLTRFLVRYYTEPGDTILDCFAGWGTRAYVTRLLGRHYIGFDVARDTVEAVNAALQRVFQRSIDGSTPTSAVVHLADGIKLEGVPDESVDCILTCPPYHDREIYQEADSDSGGYQLSRVTRGQFETLMKNGFRRAYSVLKPGKFAIYVVNDWREDGKVYPFSHLMIVWAFEAGFTLHDVAVHHLRGVTSMGIGTFIKGKFVAKAHEWILVFRK